LHFIANCLWLPKQPSWNFKHDYLENGYAVEAIPGEL